MTLDLVVDPCELDLVVDSSLTHCLTLFSVMQTDVCAGCFQAEYGICRCNICTHLKRGVVFLHMGTVYLAVKTDSYVDSVCWLCMYDMLERIWLQLCQNYLDICHTVHYVDVWWVKKLLCLDKYVCTNLYHRYFYTWHGMWLDRYTYL
jgi:hypothetical protein